MTTTVTEKALASVYKRYNSFFSAHSTALPANFKRSDLYKNTERDSEDCTHTSLCNPYDYVTEQFKKCIEIHFNYYNRHFDLAVR